jgi:hypothetical protein
MADPEVSVPQLSNEYLSQAFGQLRKVVQGIFADGYLAGYAQGDNDAIARILEAARPSANGPALQVRHPSNDRQPGHVGVAPQSITRVVVDAALTEAGPKGMTPTEIYRSPSNLDTGITLGAISKVLRRGGRKGRYGNRDGRWFLIGGQ